jgi:peptidyl-prolyl cis-trans isomerase B (cyclophilin B)
MYKAFSRMLGVVSMCALMLVACENKQEQETKDASAPAEPTQQESAAVKNPQVKITTNLGSFVVELDEQKAPITVKNYLSYVNEGFYSDTLIHRVIPGFMIQGGGFNTKFEQKPTQASIQNEANNGLKNKRGTIAMARTMDPNSASAQFFINVADNDFLDYRSSTPQGWGYAVFGKVVDGMDVVDKISKEKTGSRAGHEDVPVTDIVIESIEVVPAAEAASTTAATETAPANAAETAAEEKK